MAPQTPWKEFFTHYTKTRPYKHPNLSQSEYVYWLSRAWWWEIDLEEIDWSLSSGEIAKEYPMLEGMSIREQASKQLKEPVIGAPPEELSSEGLMERMMRLESDVTELSKELSTEEREKKEVEYERDMALRRLSKLRERYEEATAPPEIKPDEVAEDYAEYLESVARIEKTYRLPFIDLKFLYDHWNEVSDDNKTRLKMILQAIPKRVLTDLFEERYTLWIYEQTVGPWVKPLEWTDKLEQKLKDTYEATLRRANLSPKRFWPEYRLELETVKLLETEEEMIRTVEALAEDIARREIKPPRIRIPREAPRRPREIRIGPPPDEDEGEYIPPVTPAFPPSPLSPSPFPRNLTLGEKDQIWRAFADELAMRGIASLQYRKEFNEWLGTFTFKTWQQVRNHFEKLLEQIQTGKPVLFPIHEVIVPWKTTEEAVVHFASIGIYENLDKMITTLYSYGFDTTDEEVIKIIKEQYKKGNHKLIISNKENLEALIGQKLE